MSHPVLHICREKTNNLPMHSNTLIHINTLDIGHAHPLPPKSHKNPLILYRNDHIIQILLISSCMYLISNFQKKSYYTKPSQPPQHPSSCNLTLLFLSNHLNSNKLHRWIISKHRATSRRSKSDWTFRKAWTVNPWIPRGARRWKEACVLHQGGFYKMVGERETPFTTKMWQNLSWHRKNSDILKELVVGFMLSNVIYMYMIFLGV